MADSSRGTSLRRRTLVRAIGDVCRAARSVQLAADNVELNRNRTGISHVDKAATAERQAIRQLWELLGAPGGKLNMPELEDCQNPHASKL